MYTIKYVKQKQPGVVEKGATFEVQIFFKNVNSSKLCDIANHIAIATY